MIIICGLFRKLDLKIEISISPRRLVSRASMALYPSLPLLSLILITHREEKITNRLLLPIRCVRLSLYPLPTQVIVKDIQNAEQSTSHVKSISGAAESTVIAIGSANTTMVQIGSISSTYLQPLSIFNVVVSGIANVRFSKHRWSNFNLRTCIDTPIRPNGIICVDHGIQGIYKSYVIPSANVVFHSSFYRKPIWMPPSQISLPESNERTSSSWKTGLRPRSTQRKMC